MPQIQIRETQAAVSGIGMSPTSVTILGTASRGPKEPTLVRGQSELIRLFGDPTQGNLGLLTAYYSLLHSNNVKFLRVTDGTDSYSQVTTKCNPHPAWILGGADLSTSYVYWLDLRDTYLLKITVQDGSSTPVTKIVDLTGARTLDGIINKINQTFAGSGLVNEIIAQKDVYKKYLMLKTSTGEAPNFTIATGDGMSTVFTNTLPRTPVRKKSVTITTKIGGNTVTAMDDGGGHFTGTYVDKDNSTIDYTTGEITITYNSSNPPDNSEPIIATYEYEPKIILEVPPSNDATYKLFKITPPYERVGARGQRLEPVFRSRYTGNFNGYTVKVTRGTQYYHFNLTIQNQQRVVVAQLNGVTPFDVKDTLNKLNLYIMLDVDEPCEIKTGEYLLTGGSPGGSPSKQDYIDTLTAMADKIDTDLLAIPGIYDPDIVNHVLLLAEEKQTFLAIIDPPPMLTPEEVIDYHNGELSGVNTTLAFTSQYGALYYPWAKVRDKYTRREYSVPPSLWAILRTLYTDFVGAPWYAPAGIRRGIINPSGSRLEIIGLEAELAPEQREQLQSGGNAINPIVKFDTDIVIWGQRTLYRDETHYSSRINVRRLLIFLRRRVTDIVRSFLFEPISDATLRQISTRIEELLYYVKAANGVREFKVIIDETTTTPEIAATNTVKGNIILIPIFAAETISLEFIVGSTLAEFAEK